ncbi:type II toxin-antitoxin system RelE/ParE family toxin [Patescibacteria group bacterium]|nr:type II toxin-antitoxin system RelE/ParE family toxin [Patescibacteria group bacterium]
MSNNAYKSLKKLGQKIGQKVKQALISLKISPLPIKEHDIKKIVGVEDTYRIRISNYRIIYAIDWKNKEINVIRISKKDEKTYKKL